MTSSFFHILEIGVYPRSAGSLYERNVGAGSMISEAIQVADQRWQRSGAMQTMGLVSGAKAIEV